MRYFWRALFLLPILLGPVTACRDGGRPAPIRIAFSQCIDDQWRRQMLEDIQRELSFHPECSLLYRNAQGSSARQVQQLKELIEEKPDILIVSPNESGPLSDAVSQAARRGIPVIVVDRKVDTPDFTAFIGGDNYGIGQMAAQYAVQLLKGQGHILQVTGLNTSSPARERQAGFLEGIKGSPGIVVETVHGRWLQEDARKATESWLAQHAPPQLVYAHNDVMTVGVRQAFAARKLPFPRIIGVDGLPGPKGGMRMVARGEITASLSYPTNGDEAVRLALSVLRKNPVPKFRTAQTFVIDSSNVRLLQMQSDKMLSQQAAIETQQTMLERQRLIYNNQRTLLYVLGCSFLLALGLASVAYYSLRENRLVNRKLLQKNDEILTQKTLLEDMSRKAQAANEAKVNFFTNISHEFRTPLTLILGPTEELMKTARRQAPNAEQNLSLIQKNAYRLLKLVNQLIDFRKIEVDKMPLRAAPVNLPTFVNEIVGQYRNLAARKNIDLRVLSKEHVLEVWADTGLLDKVLFNLLTNAFKFTQGSGYVHVYVERSADASSAIIKVEDNGPGMSKKALSQIFDVFHQGDYETSEGSGLGLALSKEIVDLHQGRLEAWSEKDRGTVFTVTLPLGNAHLRPEERLMLPEPGMPENDHAPLYTEELDLEFRMPEIETDAETTGKEHTILVVEDNADLRRFLTLRLRQKYIVLEAADGNEALQSCFDNLPDLVLCDIVIPGMDGLTLTRIFKEDVRTSHIPIILLTARAFTESDMATAALADSYLMKPFDMNVLERSVAGTIANRTRLREHYSTTTPIALNTQKVKGSDRKFLSDLTAIVERNIANEKFSIEDIGQAMGISRIQLYRRAKPVLEVSINEFIVQTRLQKARFLLRNEPQLSVSEIAQRVGFSSAAYFSTAFKNKFGTTPRAFRQE